MQVEKHVRLFDFISPIYSLFFNYQTKLFSSHLKTIEKKIFNKKSILLIK